jgi:hypothetical protein
LSRLIPPCGWRAVILPLKFYTIFLQVDRVLFIYIFFLMESLILCDWFHTTWLEKVVIVCCWLLKEVYGVWIFSVLVIYSFLDFYLRLFFRDHFRFSNFLWVWHTLNSLKKRKCVVKFIFLSTNSITNKFVMIIVAEITSKVWILWQNVLRTITRSLS